MITIYNMQKIMGARVFRITGAIRGGKQSMGSLIREYKTALKDVVLIHVDREKTIIQCLCGNTFFIGDKNVQLLSFFQRSTQWGGYSLGTTAYRLLVETEE